MSKSTIALWVFGVFYVLLISLVMYINRPEASIKLRGPVNIKHYELESCFEKDTGTRNRITLICYGKRKGV